MFAPVLRLNARVDLHKQLAEDRVQVGNLVLEVLRVFVGDFKKEPLQRPSLVQDHLRVHLQVSNFLILFLGCVSSPLNLPLELLLLFLVS